VEKLFLLWENGLENITFLGYDFSAASLYDEPFKNIGIFMCFRASPTAWFLIKIHSGVLCRNHHCRGYLQAFRIFLQFSGDIEGDIFVNRLVFRGFERKFEGKNKMLNLNCKNCDDLLLT
jgi:hypothetical protein